MDILETVIGKLQAGEFGAAKQIIDDAKNDEAIKMQSMELVSLIADHLSDENAESKPDLYSASESLLIGLAQKCSPAEVLYEMMEKIRLARSDDILTSLLKVVQAAVLRLPAKRARCLDWVFGTIMEYLERITLPESLDKDMDDDEESLLENDETIRRFLQLYLTMMLFVKPIATRLSKPATEESLYYDTSLTQKNAVVCFILRLMGKLLPYLHLQRSVQQRRTPGRRPFPAGKSYSVQVAEDLTNVLLLLISDPYQLLSYGEKRTHGDRLLKKSASFFGEQSEQDRDDLTSNDVFMSNEKHMTEGLAVLFYLLLGEDLLPTSAPMVYDARYIFEAGLHFVVELVSGARTIVYFKGVRLAQALVRKMNGNQLTARELETPIHTTFCELYIRALERSKSVRNREVGVRVLSDYIHAFDDEGRYTILVHLLKSFEDDTVRSFAINEYKDLVVERLREAKPLPRWYRGEVLREMLTGRICTLKHGVKTDILDHSYSITSALSALWVLLKSDLSNTSRVWDCLPIIEKQFLGELRTGLDLSMAHYKNELKTTEERSGEADQSGLEGAEVSISTLNGDAPPSVMTKETRIDLSKRMILRLEMLEFHLSRITSDIEQMQTQIRKTGRNVLSRSIGGGPVAEHATTRNYIQTATAGRHFSSTGSQHPTNETFDAFRAREEQKEQEFAKQQQQQQQQTSSQNAEAGNAQFSSSASSSSSSTDSTSTDPEVERTKEMILDAALLFVRSHGWSKEAIANGAEAVNYPSVSHGLFPRGGIELVHHFYKQCNLKLIEHLKQETAELDKVPNPSDFARRAIEYRLRLLEPYLKHWPQALGLMTLPPNAPHSLANLLTLVDDICYYAGDRAVDFNWYTRRVGLACIYKTTELYMLQDSSPGFERTWKFLERRMEEASMVHEFLVKSEGATHQLQNAVGSAFTTARNILGLNFDRR